MVSGFGLLLRPVDISGSSLTFAVGGSLVSRGIFQGLNRCLPYTGIGTGMDKMSTPHGRGYHGFAFVCCVLVSLALVLLAFQEWPGLSASSHVTMSETGYAQCISNGWRDGVLGCINNLGQPNGGVRVFGLPVNATAAALFGWDGSVSFGETQFVSALFTVLAFAGSLLFFRRLSGSIWIGLLGAVLYLVSPIVSQQGGYSTLRIGYALLPLYLLVDSHLLELKRMRWGLATALVMGVVALRVFAILCDGYSFVMSSGLALSFFAVSLLVSKRRGAAAMALVIYLAACAVGYSSYFLFVPGGQAGLSTMPIDFFRGQGVDLYTTIVPSPLFWAYDALGLVFDIPKAAAFGDGSNIAFNFAGYAAIASVLVVLGARLAARKPLGAMLAALALSGLVACVLSLGPSLKYKSWDMRRAEEGARFSTYLMPADKAVMSLGTDYLYENVPGVRNIRALARWQGVVHLALVAFVLALVMLLLRRDKRRLALALALIALVESMPNLREAYVQGITKRVEADAIRDSYLQELLRLTAPRERVVLIQLYDGAEGNHFMVDYFCPKANLNCYNIAGDKAIEITRDRWPLEVEQLMVRRNIEQNIRQLFRDDSLDVAIVTLFDMRRLAYSRNAGGVDKHAVQARVDTIVAAGGYSRTDGEYFITLRPTKALLESPDCGLRCWKDWPEVGTAGRVEAWGPTSSVLGGGFNRQINGKSAFWVKVKDASDKYVIAFGGQLLPTMNNGDVVSAQLSPRFEQSFRAFASYEVSLIDIQDAQRIPLGEFHVYPPTPE